MTCGVTMTDAMASAVSVSWPPQVTNEPSPCAPVESIENGPSSDGKTRFIANRCKRMTFRSNEARKRYLTVHRLFASKTFLGDV